jgi:hypothetical protein
MTAECVYLISGIQGAGKTTVSRRLASAYERAAHIDGSSMQRMIVSGGIWPDLERPEQEWLPQLQLRARHAAMLADSFFQEGIVPVIDDIAVGEQMDVYISAIQSRPLFVVQLAPRAEIALARGRVRDRGYGGEEWLILDDVMRRENAGVGLWLDTSEMTVQGTVDAILARAPSEAAV